MINKMYNHLARLLNHIIPKSSYRLFVEPHKNGKVEKQDIINYSGDSVLTFLQYCFKHNLIENKTVILVVYSLERTNEIKQYLESFKSPTIILLPHYSLYQGVKKRIRKIQYEVMKMRSSVWMCATVHANKRYAIKKQKLICLEYFSSFKSDYNVIPFDYLPKTWSLVCSTSVLDSVTKSAAFAIPYHCFQPIGLSRNDILFKKTNKEMAIREWINTKTGRQFKKIIIYAPTFRDYEERETLTRNIWGYENEVPINNVINECDAVVIAKIHSWQNKDVISNENKNVVFFEPSYNFTIYDVMTISDLMITDYSSIGLDFLLIDKPVIYSLYDEEKYLKTRGMCVEPIEEICGGAIVKTAESLAYSIKSSLLEGYVCPESKRVKKLYFKYPDGKSCERIYEYLREKDIF